MTGFSNIWARRDDGCKKLARKCLDRRVLEDVVPLKASCQKHQEPSTLPHAKNSGQQKELSVFPRMATRRELSCCNRRVYDI